MPAAGGGRAAPRRGGSTRHRTPLGAVVGIIFDGAVGSPRRALPVPAHSTPGVCSHLPRPTRLHLGCFQNPPHPPNPVAVSHFTWWWMIIFFCDDGLFFFFIIIFFGLLSHSFLFLLSVLQLLSCLCPQLFLSTLLPSLFPLPALPSHPVVSESRGEGSAASSISLLPGGGWS